MSAGTTTTAISLPDLFPLAELTAAIESGYVKVQDHPGLPLRIFNYTERATYDRAWSDVTRQCRGLIADASGVIVARPFGKFFNYGEHPEGSLDLAAPAEVTDKLDGSLAIMYPTGDAVHPWAVATRGSFTSDQAKHATSLLITRYRDFEPPEGMTVLWEVVYPLNRIVVDYGDTDDLFLLGAVDIATGESTGPDWVTGWDGPVAETFSAATLAEALAIEPRRNAEGVVVHLTGTGTRIKLKQDDYVALHRLITGMNARVVWERLGEGETLDDLCRGLPEEFWPWVREVGADLAAERDRLAGEAAAEHQRILASLPEGWTRKDYALAAQKSPLRAWLFLLLDGRDPSAKIWHSLRPSGQRSLVAASEDTA